MLLKTSFQADGESLRSYRHGVSVIELIHLHLADNAITTTPSQAHTGDMHTYKSSYPFRANTSV